MRERKRKRSINIFKGLKGTNKKERKKNIYISNMNLSIDRNNNNNNNYISLVL